MKKTKIIYWVVTALFAALMIFSAVPDILMTPETIIFMNHLGYPDYFIPFIGIAKILGCIAILVPGFPRIKEWAYAGLAFDIIGATYSGIATDGLQLPMTFMLLPILLCILSYFYYHKKNDLQLKSIH
ncbi:MAG: DoxX family protein [Ferruginibacter sp.]